MNDCCHPFTGECQDGFGCCAHSLPATSEPIRHLDATPALYAPIVFLLAGAAIGGALVLLYLTRL